MAATLIYKALTSTYTPVGFSASNQSRHRFLKAKLGSGVRVSSRPVFVKDCIRAREGEEERTCCNPDCWTRD